MKTRRWWHYLAPAVLALAVLPLSTRCGAGKQTAVKPPEEGRKEATAQHGPNVKYLTESGDSIALDSAPRPKKLAGPDYPEAAMDASLEGEVALDVLVGKDGLASRVKGVTGPEVFRQAAVDAAKKYLWQPATFGGEPVSVWTSLRFPFRPLRFVGESGDTIAVNTAPSALELPKVRYPESALKDSLEGVVFLSMLVAKDGRVKDAKVSKGEEPFAQAAIDAAMESVWNPAISRGKPVSVWVAMPIRFTLKQRSTP